MSNLKPAIDAKEDGAFKEKADHAWEFTETLLVPSIISVAA